MTIFFANGEAYDDEVDLYFGQQSLEYQVPSNFSVSAGAGVNRDAKEDKKPVKNQEDSLELSSSRQSKEPQVLGPTLGTFEQTNAPILRSATTYGRLRDQGIEPSTDDLVEIVAEQLGIAPAARGMRWLFSDDVSVPPGRKPVVVLDEFSSQKRKFKPYEGIDFDNYEPVDEQQRRVDHYNATGESNDLPFPYGDRDLFIQQFGRENAIRAIDSIIRKRKEKQFPDTPQGRMDRALHEDHIERLERMKEPLKEGIPSS
jgi:hypothetical protein